jgi:hypothetical protein
VDARGCSARWFACGARIGVWMTERLYILSLGSQDGNRHVHWHIAPLRPGVPFDEQQLAALESNRVLDLGEDEMAQLATLKGVKTPVQVEPRFGALCSWDRTRVCFCGLPVASTSSMLRPPLTTSTSY